jgi:hypothetical protein
VFDHAGAGTTSYEIPNRAAYTQDGMICKISHSGLECDTVLSTFTVSGHIRRKVTGSVKTEERITGRGALGLPIKRFLKSKDFPSYAPGGGNV